MVRIAIIGSGFIGRAWAITFARAGHDVVLWDEDSSAPAKALGFIREMLPDLAENDLLQGRTPEDVLSRISVEADLATALAGADHVQENAPERLDVKRA